MKTYTFTEEDLRICVQASMVVCTLEILRCNLIKDEREKFSMDKVIDQSMILFTEREPASSDQEKEKRGS